MKLIPLLAALLLLILPASRLHAQLCGGHVNFKVLNEATRALQQFETTESQPIAECQTLQNKKFKIRVTHTKGTYFTAVPAYGFYSMCYGCATSATLRIHRKGSLGSMVIHFRNLCDWHFGLDIVFKPGVYELDVCPPGRKVALTELYPNQVNAGLNITPLDWSTKQ